MAQIPEKRIPTVTRGALDKGGFQRVNLKYFLIFPNYPLDIILTIW